MKSRASKISKRWLIFFAVWFIVFAFAPLRYIAQSQLQNSLWPLSKIFHAQKLGQTLTDLAPQFPNDARVWAGAADEIIWPEVEYSDSEDEDSAPIRVEPASPPPSPLFPGKILEDQHAETRRRLDLVIEKFPRESWLIAKRLRLSWGYMDGDRVGGELSDSNVYANQAAGKPSPERDTSKGYPNYSPAELARVLELCKRGQKLEPNNAFYDWTLSYFLALSWRDAQAWNALDSAARKTQWSDHRAEETQAVLATRELLLGRPLLWEEKSRIILSNPFSTEFNNYYNFARILSWQSIKAQRRKDHAQALRLAGNLAHVASTMRENSRYFIEGSVAASLERIAVQSPTWATRLRTTYGRRSPRRTVATDAVNFKAYAMQHDRKGLAAWIARDAVRAMAFHGSAAITNNSILGTSLFHSALIGALWRAGVLLLLILPFALYGWLISDLLFRIPRAKRILQLENPKPKIAPREIWNGALACSGARAIGAALFAAAIFGLTALTLLIGFGQGNQIWSDFITWWNSTFSPATPDESVVAAFAYQTININTQPENSMVRFEIVVGFVPILLGLLWCAGRARDWQEMQKPRDETAPPEGVLALLKAILTGKIFAHAMEYDLAGTGILLARGFVFGAFCAAWIALAVMSENNGSVLVPMILAPLFFALLMGETISRWRRSTHRRAAARFGLRLLRESWLGWLTLGSALFVLTLLLSLPLRNRADVALNRILKVGEIAALQNK